MEKFELIIVFKKEITVEQAERILANYQFDFHEGMDSSKGKIYFYKTGPKFIAKFQTKNNLDNFLTLSKSIPEIYEVYKPNWEIVKD